jgi:hypothetical protein
MGWRWWYFGQWEPNTAVAQHISVKARAFAMLHAPADAWLDNYHWLMRVGNSLQIFQVVFLPALVLLLRRNRLALERGVLILVSGLACVAQYAMFGPARMDEARTVTELALYSTALVPFMVLGRDVFRFRDLLTGLAMVACSVAIADARAPDRSEVGWGTEWFESNADEAAGIAREHGIPRPTFANADLGAVSWRKQFNVLDIGELGSAVTPRMNTAWYLVFAQPDIVEIHDYWSCANGGLFTDPEFVQEYVPVRTARTPWLAAACGGFPAAVSGFWVRRAVTRTSNSEERALLEAFERTRDVDHVRRELAQCVLAPGKRPCGYVGRTLYRYVPELKREGLFTQVEKLLASDPRLTLEHAYFTSSEDGRWWQRILSNIP